MTQRFYSYGHHPKIPNYRNDGAGRDTYISFYNGGFGNYKISNIYSKDPTESPRHYYHQNLALCKPTKRYYTDGGGRDLYVYNSLKEENDKCKGNLRLNNILRSYDNVQFPLRISKNLSPSKFEKKLLDRIFYGNSTDVKDRLMSPKVKFLKKEAIKKRMDENINIDNIDEERNNGIVEEKNNKKNHSFRYNNICAETEPNNIKSTTGIEFNNKAFNLRKTPKKYKLELGQSDNLVNSVKKIFLYNNNKNHNIFTKIKILDVK